MAFNESTRMKPEWIQRVWSENPVRRAANGNILLVARTAFCQVLGDKPKDKAGKERAWGSVLLLPDFDLIGGRGAIKIIDDAALALIGEKMPAALKNQDLADKLHKPIKKQGTYVNTGSEDGDLYEGFVPGRYCISANSPQSRPSVVDQNLAPLIDKSDVYSGCWVIAAIKEGWIPVKENPGPTFYLQSLMKIADDNSLGGMGVSNPAADFAGVKVDQTVNPAAAFGVEGHTAGAVEPSAVDLLG